MAMVTQYGINLQVDSTLLGTVNQEKAWQAVIFYQPSVSASGPTAPSGTMVTNGPLGATGTATATYSHGDGTTTGFADPLEAIQRALIYIEGMRSANIGSAPQVF